jgi:hypothetical protein
MRTKLRGLGCGRRAERRQCGHLGAEPRLQRHRVKAPLTPEAMSLEIQPVSDTTAFQYVLPLDGRPQEMPCDRVLGSCYVFLIGVQPSST